MIDRVKINLGCGKNKQDGYVNIDIQERVKPDVVCDVLKGLPYEDSSVDEVRAFDFLEHIETIKNISVIEEIWRVLRPGGKFESFTPDAECGQGAFQDPTHVSFWTEGRWLYFSHPAYRDLYGIKANFRIQMQRVNTDPINRIFHLHVIAFAIKTEKELAL
jgi:predicted SAM-dependent methyltransferase